MFEPFTRARLDQLLRQHLVSAAGHRYIESALAAPSRNVTGTTQNVPSAIPNPKMMFTLQSESKNGERPHVLEKTFDPNCIGFVTQPPRIEIRYRGRNGKTVRSPYTPDCLAFYKDRGVVAEEWKPASERARLDDLYPGKYSLHMPGVYGSGPIEAIFSPMGIRFALRFSDEISEVAHRNRQFLWTYQQPYAEQKYLPLLEELRAKFAGLPQQSVGDLVESGANRDVIYWALATGRLFFEIESVPLATQAALAQVFRHQSTLVAWRAAVRPDGSRPNSRTTDGNRQLEAGEVLVLDGRRLTIRFIGNTGITARDDSGDSYDLNFAELEQAQLAGKLTLPAHLGQQHVRSRFYTASPAALQRALVYAEILRKLDRGEELRPEDRYSAATIRRWRKKVREGQSKGWSPVESLIDEASQRGFHGPHIDLSLSNELNKDIGEALKNRLNKSKLTIYGEIEKKWLALGKKMVAKSSFYERVKKIESPDTIRASQGHKVAHQIQPAFWILEERTPIHAEHAMAWVHIDSTLLDIELRSSLSGSVLGRPWLTVAICAFTRRIVGYHLSFRPPSYVSSMMVLADVIRRTGRLPDAIIHDWGSEFKAKDFKECLAALFIERLIRPKGSPRFGSPIERIFGITTQELIANLAGNTKARKNVRMLSPNADPSWHSGLWLLDLYLHLDEYFFGIYNARKHPTTLLSPDAAFETSLVMQGQRLHRLRRLEDLLPIISPVARGRTRVLDPARGLYVNYRHYSNPMLAERALRGEEIVVRPVPFDPGLVLTFFKGQWVACRTQLAPEVASAPEVVRRCLYEEWSIEQQLVNHDSDRARQELVSLIEELNVRALENKEYWSERKFHDLLGSNVFPATDFSDHTPAQSERVNQLTQAMGNAVRAALASPRVGRLAGS